MTRNSGEKPRDGGTWPFIETQPVIPLTWELGRQPREVVTFPLFTSGLFPAWSSHRWASSWKWIQAGFLPSLYFLCFEIATVASLSNLCFCPGQGRQRHTGDLLLSGEAKEGTVSVSPVFPKPTHLLPSLPSHCGPAQSPTSTGVRGVLGLQHLN